MAKKKTRADKIRTSQRKSSGTIASGGGYKAIFSPMSGSKSETKITEKTKNELKYFHSDLTKVLVLTMLALASEIVLWLILKH